MSPGAIIVGFSGLTHLGGSLLRAADALGLAADLCDVRLAQSRRRLLNSLAWRLCDRMPPYPGRLERALVAAVARRPSPVVVTTGNAPVTRALIEDCRRRGAKLVHFSSDDPWNPNFKSRWHFAALPAYDIVFTPRRANLDDLRGIGCADVRWMPFGYDASICEAESDAEAAPAGPAPDALFVGGADADRVQFFREYAGAGGRLSVAGGYWDTVADAQGASLGHQTPEAVRALTRAAKVNLILVRRANRDGHVMRSLEAGAIGGCLAVEDTEEHRELFGADGEAVRYFTSPADAAQVCRDLLADEAERRRLRQAVRTRIRTGRHTYADRLTAMLEAAGTMGLTP